MQVRAAGVLDTQQRQALLVRPLQGLPGEGLVGIVALEPPIAVVEVDAPAQAVTLVAPAAVPDGAIDEKGVPWPGEALVAQIARRLDAAPAERPTVAQLAARLGLTPRQLLYQFRKASQMSEGEPDERGRARRARASQTSEGEPDE